MQQLQPSPVIQAKSLQVLDHLTVKLQGVDRFKIQQGFSQPQQYTESYVFLIIVHGEAVLKLADGEYPLSPERVYFVGAEQTYGIEQVGPEGLEGISMRFDLYIETGNYKRIQRWRDDDSIFHQPIGRPYSPTEPLLPLCEKVHYYWHSEQELGHFRSQLEFHKVLYYLAQWTNKQTEDSNSSLQRTKLYIDEHYSENLTLERLAAMAGLSQKYFVDVFKKRYGMSTIDYITQLRMNTAKRMMTTSDLRLRDIAHYVGYHDEFYFSRKFKKAVGISPSLYMQNRRRKIAAYSTEVIGYLIPLGIIPYAAPMHPKWSGFYYQTYGKDIPVHLSAFRQGIDWESNLHILQEASPDTIICMDTVTHEEKKRLEEIAPIQYISTSEGGWREQLMQIASTLNEEAEATNWLQSLKAKLLSVKNLLSLELKNRRIAILRLEKNNLHVYSSRSIAEIVFGELGMESAYLGEKVYNDLITIEELHHLDADHLLLMVRQEDETLAYWKTLQDTPAWNDLKAVRQGGLHLINSNPWLEYSPAAHDRIIDEIRQLFIGK